MSGVPRPLAEIVSSLRTATGTLVSNEKSQMAGVVGWLRSILGQGDTSFDSLHSSLKLDGLQWCDRNSLPKGHAFNGHDGQVFKVPLEQLSPRDGEVLLLMQPAGPEGLLILASVSGALHPEQVVSALSKRFEDIPGVTFGFFSRPSRKLRPYQLENATDRTALENAEARDEAACLRMARHARWFDTRKPIEQTAQHEKPTMDEEPTIGPAEQSNRKALSEAINRRIDRGGLSPNNQTALRGWMISLQRPDLLPSHWPQPYEGVRQPSEALLDPVLKEVLLDSDPFIWVLRSADERLRLPEE